MAERLTGKDKKGSYLIVNGCCIEKQYFTDMRETMNSYYAKKLIDKLAQFEDIMDKYGIKNIRQLDARLSGEDKSHKSAIGYMKDRDTWKRACELACEELDIYASKEDDNMSTANYFYQQSKKERRKSYEARRDRKSH